MPPLECVPNIRLCKTDSCGKVVDSRGFCTACYYRHLRNGLFERGSQTPRKRHRLRDIDNVSKTAVCAVCGQTKITNRNKQGTQWRCTTEANARSALYKKAYRQAKKIQMGNVCEICGLTSNETKLVWDHNHAKNEFRGTLCLNCNTGIGLLRDNPKIVQAAYVYLIEKGNYSYEVR